MVAAPLAKPALRSVPGNILANFFGRGAVALMALLCAPAYLRYLGAEGYGVVGLYITLQGVLSLLDMGMGAAVTRGLAQGVEGRVSPAELGSLLRTLESIYIAVGILAGCILFAVAPLLADYWVKPVHLTHAEVELSVRLMAVAIACSWVTPLYSGALGGLQSQLELNIVLAAGAVLRWAGAALVLMLGWSTVADFFVWQIIAGAVQSFGLFLLVWKIMPASGAPPRFDWRSLREVWRFAAGVSVISVVGILMSQVDKVILSKLVPLSDFGQYMLASQFATALSFFAVPVFAAVFPHFAKLAVSGERDVLVRHFHYAAQLVAVLVFPCAFTLGFFAPEILRLWGRSTDVSMAIALLPFLVAGSAINIMVNPPYTLQLAMGRTRALAVMNIVALAAFLPVLLGLISWGGVNGAALAWLLLNVGYLLIGVPAAMGRGLPLQLARWYGVDLAIPAVVAFAVALLARLCAPPWSPVLTALAGAMSVGAGIAAAAAVSPATRPRLVWVLHRIAGRQA